MTFDFIWCKDDRGLLQQVERKSNCIALDPVGKQFTSESFAQFVQEEIVVGGSQLAFVIGGPDGLPDQIRQKLKLISLSSMTFTHQMTRLILVEQLYRATEILRGSKYHRAG
jgi:23S rRNA (pseudouridine1915-N3)-methyltransferase